MTGKAELHPFEQSVWGKLVAAGTEEDAATTEVLRRREVAAANPTCNYCGSLAWTVRNYGRITHKEACPHRVDPWHQGNPEARGARVVARFYNEDGVEMPPLYQDDEHGLTCTWNYLPLIAPHIDEALRQIGTPTHVPHGFNPLDWWQHRACKQGEIARDALGLTAADLTRATWENNTPTPQPSTPKEQTPPEASAGATVADTSSRAEGMDERRRRLLRGMKPS